MSLWQKLFPKKPDRTNLSRKKRKKKQEARMTWDQWALLGGMIALAFGIAVWSNIASNNRRAEDDEKAKAAETAKNNPDNADDPKPGNDPAEEDKPPASNE